LERILGTLVSTGLKSADWRLRQQSLKLLVPLIESVPSWVKNTYEVRNLFEEILGMVKDDSALVSLAAKN